MALAAPPKPKINTKATQQARGSAARPAPRGHERRTARGAARVSGDTRGSVRGPGPSGD